MINDVTRSQDTLRSKAAEARDSLNDMAHIAKESVQETFHDLKDKAVEKYGASKQKLGEIEARLAQHVQESPMISVMLAAGAGLALGFWWRRR